MRYTRNNFLLKKEEEARLELEMQEQEEIQRQQATLRSQMNEKKGDGKEEESFSNDISEDQNLFKNGHFSSSNFANFSHESETVSPTDTVWDIASFYSDEEGMESQISVSTIESIMLKNREPISSDSELESLVQQGATASFMDNGEFLLKKSTLEPLTKDEQDRLDFYKDFKNKLHKKLEVENMEQVQNSSNNSNSSDTAGLESGADEGSNLSAYKRTLNKSQLAGAFLGKCMGINNRGTSVLPQATELFFKDYMPTIENRFNEAQINELKQNISDLEKIQGRMSQVQENMEHIREETNEIKRDSEKAAQKFRLLYYLKFAMYLGGGIFGMFLIGFFFGIRPQQVINLFPNLNFVSSVNFNGAASAAQAEFVNVSSNSNSPSFIKLLISILLNPSNWGFDK